MQGQELHAERQFQPAQFFAFRTALLPFQVLLDWAEGMTAGRVPDEGATEALLRDERTELCRRLRGRVALPEIREALFVASPSTYADLIRWLAPGAGSDRRLEQTLARYFERMAGRATPFGLFAGCSVGTVDSETRILLRPRAEYRKYSRLDTDYLFALADSLDAKPEIRGFLVYTPNSSLYRLAGRWRYVRSNLTGRQRTHQLVAIDADEYLDATVQRARDGARVEDLVRHVLSIDADGDITRDDATDYVFQLIDRQVLVSNLAPVVTGPEAIDDMIEQLRPVQSAQAIRKSLEEVRRGLRAIDTTPPGTDPQEYQAINRTLDGLGVQANPSRLFQVDLIKPCVDATLGRDVIGTITRGIEVLHRIAPPPSNDGLQRFREAFTARYERRTMPLVEVLDEESGIGFNPSSAPTAENAPLLEGLPLSAAETPRTPWTSRDSFLLWKLEEVLRAGGTVLELSETDLESLKSAQGPLPLPDAFSAMVIVAPSERNDNGPLVYVRGVLGPAGANLLGRFCRADIELNQHVRTLLAAEEAARPEAVFAEIVHLPEGRMGNVLARPVLRDYELVYLGRSGAPVANRIPITDLTVSIEDAGRIVLRSIRLAGREVVPRMTNAHAYGRGQSIYRFICTLQTQNVTGRLGWTWGALDAASFLPRVSAGRVVLSRARWRVGRQELIEFCKPPFAEGFRALQRWRRERELSRFMALVDGDNELPVDFENVLSIEAFLAIVKKRDTAMIVEMFPGPDQLAATGREGSFVHEAIVPFVRTRRIKEPTRESNRVAPISMRRFFPPGSEWAYVKWYTGTSGADSLLSTVLPPLVSRLERLEGTDRWFFIRYGDPEWHLRIRFHVPPDRLATAMDEAATAITPPMTDGRVWKVQVDTYEREIERYGGDFGMLASEEIFWRDSQAVLRILQQLAGEAGTEARWRLCLVSWDLLLSDLGFPLDAKLRIVQESRSGYARQVRSGKAFDRALGDRFRRERKSLEALFDPAQHAAHPLASALDLLGQRSRVLEPVMSALRSAELAGDLNVPLTSLAAMYLHVHANRLLRSSHQSQELVLCDFLTRIYESQIARTRGRASRRAMQGV